MNGIWTAKWKRKHLNLLLSSERMSDARARLQIKDVPKNGNNIHLHTTTPQANWLNLNDNAWLFFAMRAFIALLLSLHRRSCDCDFHTPKCKRWKRCKPNYPKLLFCQLFENWNGNVIWFSDTQHSEAQKLFFST